MPIKKRVKKNTFKLFLFLCLSIILVFSILSCKKVEETVTGSGNRSTAARDLGSFNAVVLRTPGNLIIEQGDKESITIEVDDNLIPLLKTDISMGALYIGFKSSYNIELQKLPDFYLTVKDLNVLTSDVVSSIEVQDFNTEILTINLNSLGSIVFDNIIAEEITSNVFGVGYITLSGKVDQQIVNSSGLGLYNAEELESNICTVKLEAIESQSDVPVCIIVINVSDSLIVSLKGEVDVCYRGNPEVFQSISGSGIVKKLP